MEPPEVEIKELNNRRYLVVIEDRPDAIGPFTRAELRALYEALEDWINEEEY